MKPNLAIFAVLLFLPLFFYGQSRWLRTYHDDWDTPFLDIELSYDGGYLISGRQIPNYPKYNWLIKTDINGEILWEKLIGDGLNDIVLINMDQGQAGEIFLSGLTGAYGDYSDPIIVKLDQCGEKEWCRAIPSYDNLDYAYDVCATADGGCAFSLSYTGTEPGVDRICIMKVDREGNELWKYCYNGSDTNIISQDQSNMIIAPDNGFLISGYCYYRDPDPPHYNWLHPYFIKADSAGIFQWELIVNKDFSHSGGEAFNTILDPDKLFYYSAASHYHHGDVSGDSPALVKIDLSGNQVGFYDLADPDYYGKMFDLGFLSDSTLAVSAIWGDESHEPMAVIIDTLGNITNSSYLLSNDYMSYVRTTVDDKILFYTLDLKEDNNYGVYLFKLNHLLIDDTLFLQPFRYDSLCERQIIYDTIFTDDCELILDIEETPIADGLQSKTIKAFPNPCQDYIGFVFNDDETPCHLDIYTVFGQLLYSEDINKFEKDLNVNIHASPPGMIFAVFRYPEGKIETVRIIKM